jgi:hypothetical protein
MPKKKVIEEQLEKDVKKDLEEVDEDEVKDALEEVEEEGAGEAAGRRYLATLKLLKQQQLDVGGGGAGAAEAVGGVGGGGVGGVGGGGAEGAEGGPEAAGLQRRHKQFAQDVAEAKRRRKEVEQQLEMEELQQQLDAERSTWKHLLHNLRDGHNAKLRAQHHQQMQEQQQMQQQQGSASYAEGSATAASYAEGSARAASYAEGSARATATAADAAAEASDDGGSGDTEMYGDDSDDGCQPPYVAN